MSSLVVIDGQSFQPDQAKISVFDRGFLYGDSVFETIRTYGGKLYALQEHLLRLARSAERVAIDLPMSTEELAAEIRRAVAQAGNEESYVRVMVTRGSGPMGLTPPVNVGATRVIIVAPLVPPPPEAYERGVSVVTYRTQRVVDATDAQGAKVGNYLVAVLAMREAERAGAHEALIVDGSENVVEGSTSNVFALIDGQLVTPPEEAGILAGITRARVLAICRARGRPVVERPLALSELSRAEEVMLSSSIREILPVVRVDSHVVGEGAPGGVARELLADFRESAMKSVG